MSEDKGAEEASLTRQLLRHAVNTAYLGEISAPDGYTFMQKECGDTIEVFLAICNKRIFKARFQMQGCHAFFVCASAAMALVEGRSPRQAMKIDAKLIEETLGGLPESHRHCAEDAVLALKKALQDFYVRGKDGWKKMYPR